MRVLQWRRGRVLKSALIVAGFLVAGILLVRSLAGGPGHQGAAGPLQEALVVRGKPEGNGRVPNKSYPDDLAVFVGTTHLRVNPYPL